jgi:5-methylcytosine-specific restriction endonuclease McrA
MAFPHIAQVLNFDPTELLAKLTAKGKIKPFSRRQDISVDDVLPSQPAGLCACGCGVKIVPPRRKWAADSCAWFGYAVQGILLNDRKEVLKYLQRQRKAAGLPVHACWHCGKEGKLEVDHILAVKLGGGGRWLDNYQLLCPHCHQTKTNEDNRLIRELKRTTGKAVTASPVA